MPDFNFDDPAERGRAIHDSLAAKIPKRPKVDNQGRPLDNDKSQKLYHYDAAGILTNIETVTTTADDDAA